MAKPSSEIIKPVFYIEQMTAETPHDYIWRFPASSKPLSIFRHQSKCHIHFDQVLHRKVKSISLNKLHTPTQRIAG